MVGVFLALNADYLLRIQTIQHVTFDRTCVSVQEGTWNAPDDYCIIRRVEAKLVCIQTLHGVSWLFRGYLIPRARKITYLTERENLYAQYTCTTTN